MQEESIDLQTLLNAFYTTKNNKVKKRLIFDQTHLGGIGSKWIKAFFLSLPILLYIGIFNPKIFGMLGIAQAIIFYIVFLSMVMIMVTGLTFINNNKVIRQVKPSWHKLFPTVELTQVLSGGATPYKDFIRYYEKALEDTLENEALHTYLDESFQTMQKENSELYEMMHSGKNRS